MAGQAQTHRERLLRSGFRLLYANGFHGTTVDRLLDDAGVPKGSFYHHFGSKEAFGVPVLDRYEAAQSEALQRWIERDDLSVPARLEGYHQEFVDRFVGSGWHRACLTGKLANELVASSDAYRRRLASGFDSWKGQICSLLADGQQRGEVRDDVPAEQLADGVLAMIQGGFVGALTLRDLDSLRAVTKSLVELVRAQP